jgi:uncharacterized membrane protein
MSQDKLTALVILLWRFFVIYSVVHTTVASIIGWVTVFAK